jgi:uncharacterized FlaG/YvyC family protein
MRPKKTTEQKDQDQMQDLKDEIEHLKERVEELQSALEFIYDRASRPNIWYAVVAADAIVGYQVRGK